MVTNRAHTRKRAMHEENQDVKTKLCICVCVLPRRGVVRCAGVEGGIVVAKCDDQEWGYGYNAASSEYGDLLKGGVLDPAKVMD